MKKTIIGIMAATLALSSGLTSPAFAQYQERTIRVGSTLSPEHPTGVAINAMAACAAERTDGQMTIQGIFNAALGGDQEMSQAARAGTLDMFVTTTSPLVGLESRLGVFDLPFMFNSTEEVNAVLDGEFGQFIGDLMPEHDLVKVSFWDYGFRQLTNSRRAVASVEDFQGLRVRVIQNNIFIDAFSALGANPIPMSWGEVFPALETGAIDGQENPLLTIYDAQLYDVQDYLSLTNHVYAALMLLYSETLFNQLSTEEQAVVMECAAEAQTIQRAGMAERADAALAALEEEGMEIVRPEPAAVDAMREAMGVVYETHAETIGQDVIDRLNAELATIRGQ
ncbi:DctP family TRAP transporter solute-binding subunit [Arsenicitalea aurantiaca]|nr:DctP family TRAP transporter solute-binding subunit [Arsenicitalea aurantiaca]